MYISKNPLNRVLRHIGIQVSMHRGVATDEFMQDYRRNLDRLRKDPGGYEVFEEPYCDIGEHPVSYADHECGFAAEHVNRLGPANILDIGSYRLFIVGLLSSYKVTTIDVASAPL